MKAALIAALLSSPAFAAELQALVLTGATSEAAAAPLLEAAKTRAMAVVPWVTLAEGFPKVVDSATVKGLKPGFWIVLAGFCATVDPALKALDPGAYSKPVEVEKAACPVVLDGWTASTLEVKDADKRTLRGVLFQPKLEDQWRLFLTVRDAAGAPIAARDTKESEVSGCIYAGTAELKAGKGGALVVKTSDCARPRGCPNPGLATTQVTFALKGTEIADTLVVLKDIGMRGCSGE